MSSTTTIIRKPFLNEAQAYGLLANAKEQLLYCGIYVLPLHYLSSTRSLPLRSRDDPAVIRARVRAVCLSTTACSLITLIILRRSPMVTGHRLNPGVEFLTDGSQPALYLMGYWPPGLLETFKALLLTALLFAGPIYEGLLVEGWGGQWLKLVPMRLLWEDWPTWRNIVAGPISEECLFRSAAIPLLLHSDIYLSHIIFRSPLVFGIAHLHHFYELRISHPHTPLRVAMARSAFQLLYTWVFGIYITFIFLRTGSLMAVICVHMTCNTLGLPRLWGAVDPHWTRGGSHDLAARAMWTTFYYVLLVGGFLLWYLHLFTLTQSSKALVEF
ncbi:hypothetical protein CP533_6806 [Ophiocordyceps camponoti-saundersi (nom. inval.)]|nr:hypothetical protein CP533_6806 [Ophiocordyceps camponoti-saundersi (nom. inval.)]